MTEEREKTNENLESFCEKGGRKEKSKIKRLNSNTYVNNPVIYKGKVIVSNSIKFSHFTSKFNIFKNFFYVSGDEIWLK